MHDVAFRVDASQVIGTGHVMRCLVLADELRAQGVGAIFICRPHLGHMADYISGQGYRVVLLSVPDLSVNVDKGNSYADWLGASWQLDAQETVAALYRHPIDWLVADHYAVDARWENYVRSHAGLRIMAIDGQANRTHACDVLLDPTYSPDGRHRWQDLVPSSCRMLLGPQYALLRPEFARARAALRRQSEGVRRVVMAFGGVDKINATELALMAMRDDRFAQIAVDVITGVGNPHYDCLAAACADSANIHLHRQPPNVAELMAAADVAISAGGTMLLEQCYMHLPSLVVGVADNQIGLCQALDGAGAIQYLGRLQDDNRLQMRQTIQTALTVLMQNKDRLEQMRDCCRQLMYRPADVSAASLLVE